MRCRSPKEPYCTVIVAVALFVGYDAQPVFQIFTQYCVVERSFGVVNDAELVPTGVVVVPDGPGRRS